MKLSQSDRRNRIWFSLFLLNINNVIAPYISRAGNRAAPDISFVNKYPPSWMKKVGFSKFSSILSMLPLIFIAMNTLHSFLDPAV